MNKKHPWFDTFRCEGVYYGTGIKPDTYIIWIQICIHNLNSKTLLLIFLVSFLLFWLFKIFTLFIFTFFSFFSLCIFIFKNAMYYIFYVVYYKENTLYYIFSGSNCNIQKKQRIISFLILYAISFFFTAYILSDNLWLNSRISMKSFVCSTPTKI
jgi:hypothetical protein